MKLNTYEGVFIPTTLNVLSILIYLRFGFIVGEAGILGSLMLLVVSYTINLLTTLSVSAIATNGFVQGGGAYYMISRSLGAEFGGSIGMVFYIGQVLNAGLNIVGFADPLINNFGKSNGSILPSTSEWKFFYETILLIICTAICLVGPQLFARSSKLLFVVLLISTLGIPTSVLFMRPFYVSEYDSWYTGPSWKTLKDNWLPYQPLTSSELKDTIPKGVAGFGRLFGIFFSATAGILAGASMSGDLVHPSRAIPRGTLSGLALTFVMYAMVIIAVGISVSRELLIQDMKIISTISASPTVVLLGEFATSIFSALMGVFGAAKLLHAIAEDNLIPLLGIFKNTNAAILATYLLTQTVILYDVNEIAVYITMTLLMTFVVLNLACFLLEVASAPNFRPSFRYFNAPTAFLGFIVCIGAMLVADAIAALVILILGVLMFVVIHFCATPKPWGDVSQSLIYHQVRKYLLKLKQDHVKYWRPQILLFVDDPKSGWQLIRFCNYLKKGGLFIMGHVVLTSPEQNDCFQSSALEIDKQRSAWEKLRDMHNIKAFIQINASTSIVWGARNVYLGSGLGGMRPNITVLGFYDEHESGQSQNFSHINMETFPTDDLRKERHLGLSQWIQVIEDLLSMGSNVCVGRGFINATLPASKSLWSYTSDSNGSKSVIDLYPIQMSARLINEDLSANGTSINFDTYTLILQLGSILHSVKAWYTSHVLRVIAFVEHSTEVARETSRITELLDTLRIRADVIVRSLDVGNVAYDVIVKGAEDTNDFVKQKLKSSKWYSELCEARKVGNSIPRSQKQFVVPKVCEQRRLSINSLQKFGVAHSMQSTRWLRTDLRTMGESSDVKSVASFEDEVEHATPQPNSANSESLQCQFTETEVGPSFQDESMDVSDLILSSRERCSRSSPSEGLRFNDLPASAQHLIINFLMKQVSKDSTVIFTNLPAPELGTYKNKHSAEKYYDLLRLLCDDLPPTALVHARSMTVTTDL